MNQSQRRMKYASNTRKRVPGTIQRQLELMARSTVSIFAVSGD